MGSRLASGQVANKVKTCSLVQHGSALQPTQVHWQRDCGRCVSAVYGARMAAACRRALGSTATACRSIRSSRTAPLRSRGLGSAAGYEYVRGADLLAAWASLAAYDSAAAGKFLNGKAEQAKESLREAGFERVSTFEVCNGTSMSFDGSMEVEDWDAAHLWFRQSDGRGMLAFRGSDSQQDLEHVRCDRKAEMYALHPMADPPQRCREPGADPVRRAATAGTATRCTRRWRRESSRHSWRRCPRATSPAVRRSSLRGTPLAVAALRCSPSS